MACQGFYDRRGGGVPKFLLVAHIFLEVPVRKPTAKLARLFGWYWSVVEVLNGL